MQTVRKWLRARGSYHVQMQQIGTQVVLTLQSTAHAYNPRGCAQRSDLAPTLLQASGNTARAAVRNMQKVLVNGVTVWYVPAGKMRQRNILHPYN